MINLTSNIGDFKAALTYKTQKLTDEIKNIETNPVEGSDFVIPILKDSKAATQNLLESFESYIEEKEHFNLVLLTDDELDRLCGG